MDILIVLFLSFMAIILLIAAFLIMRNRPPTITPMDVPSMLWKSYKKGHPNQRFYYRLSFGLVMDDRIDLGGNLAQLSGCGSSLFNVLSYAPYNFERWEGTKENTSWAGADMYLWRPYIGDDGKTYAIFATVVDPDNNILPHDQWPPVFWSLLN